MSEVSLRYPFLHNVFPSILLFPASMGSIFKGTTRTDTNVANIIHSIKIIIQTYAFIEFSLCCSLSLTAVLMEVFSIKHTSGIQCNYPTRLVQGNCTKFLKCTQYQEQASLQNDGPLCGLWTHYTQMSRFAAIGTITY